MTDVNDVIMNICSNHHVSLYDVEIKSTNKGKVMIVYITKIGGVSISDCKRVSRDLRNLFEQEERVEANYFLEVSSPGLERKLYQKKHYKSAINERVKVVFQDGEATKTVEGTLKEVMPDYITVAEKEEKKIDFHSIKKASTVFFLTKKEIK